MQRSGHIGKILVRPPKSIPPSAPRVDFYDRSRGSLPDCWRARRLCLATRAVVAAKGAPSSVMSRSAKASTEVVEALAGVRAKRRSGRIGCSRCRRSGGARPVSNDAAGSKVPLKGVFHAAMVVHDASQRISIVRGSKRYCGQRSQVPSIWISSHAFWARLFRAVSSAAALSEIPARLITSPQRFPRRTGQRRRAEGLPALAVAWGAIRDVAIWPETPPSNQALATRMGAGGLFRAEALAAWNRC